MSHNFQRPNLPYDAYPLPNNNAFVILENLKRPIPGIIFDSTFNYIIDSMNQLDTDIINVVAGIIPGTDDPSNNKTVLGTLGASDQSWIKITGDYVEDESLPGTKLIPESVGPEQIANGAITDDKVANVGLSLNKVNIPDESIPWDKLILEDNTIDGKYLKAVTVPGSKIKNKDISQTQIGLLSVGTGELINSSVTLAKLAAEVSKILIPIGTIIAYAGNSLTSLNDLFVDCGGSTISRTEYAELFAIIGTTYGAGDGSTTFTLPDLRGRCLVGISQNGSTGGLITNATASNITLGGTFGAETHTLTVPQIPSHNHFLGRLVGMSTGGVSIPQSFSGVEEYNTSSTGGGQAHNNAQPSMFLRFYIRAR